MIRQPISKRLRFDVFKRDGFRCAYCGAHPPDVILHCDHIHPVAEGGATDIDNLVTACAPCNSGKADKLLSDVPQSLSERAAIVSEIEEQIVGYEAVMRERRARIERDAEEALEALCTAFNRDSIPMAHFHSVKRFIDILGLNEVLEAIDIAATRFRYTYRTGFRYFCGVCWRRINPPPDDRMGE